MRVGESNGAEVSERNQGRTLLKVLNDPLRILLAQVSRGSESLGDGLASADVCDGRGAGGGRGSGDCDGDGVASLDCDTSEVGGEGREVFEPSCAIDP